jgi:phosphate transport system ATP-binding protein
MAFSLSMKENTVTLIGPSGCGKSYLRLLNRMNDLIDGTKMTGSVIIDGVDIYGKKYEC